VPLAENLPHVRLIYAASRAGHRLNRYTKRAVEIFLSAPLRARCGPCVVHHKCAVTAALSYACNLVFKDARTTDASFAPRYRTRYGRGICSIKINIRSAGHSLIFIPLGIEFPTINDFADEALVPHDADLGIGRQFPTGIDADDSIYGTVVVVDRPITRFRDVIGPTAEYDR
jgi:hypothetical protein